MTQDVEMGILDLECCFNLGSTIIGILGQFLPSLHLHLQLVWNSAGVVSWQLLFCAYLLHCVTRAVCFALYTRTMYVGIV